MKLILLHILLIQVGLAYGQAYDASPIIYLDNSETDSLIRNKLDISLSSSYYVFLYPLYGAVTTFAPQIIKEYSALKQFNIRKCNEDVLIIFDNTSGLAESKIRRYMKEAFLLSEEDLKKINFVVDNELYHRLNFGGELAKLFYICRSRVAYRKDCKLNSIADEFLPHEQFTVSFESKIKLDFDSMLILEKDNLTTYSDGHLLLLSEIEGNLLDIDVATGNVRTIDLPIVDPELLYCDLIAHSDSQKCDFAKKYHYLSRATNRKTFAVNSVFFQNGYINAFFTIEAYENNSSIYKFLDDNGKWTTFDKGIPILTAYYGLLRIDSNNNAAFIEIENISFNKDIEKYPRFANGVRISEDTFFTTNLYSPTNNKNKSISTFTLKGRNLRFSGDLSGRVSSSLQNKLSYNNIKNFFFDLNDNSYYVYDVAGYVFDLYSGEVQATLFGDGITPNKQESYKTYIEEEKQVNLNYDIHAIGKIFNGEYLIAYYLYNGNPVFEIKDKYLSTQDVIWAKDIPMFQHYAAAKNRKSICFAGNRVHYISLEDDIYYLNTFVVSLTCKPTDNSTAPPHHSSTTTN